MSRSDSILSNALLRRRFLTTSSSSVSSSPTPSSSLSDGGCGSCDVPPVPRSGPAFQLGSYSLPRLPTPIPCSSRSRSVSMEGSGFAPGATSSITIFRCSGSSRSPPRPRFRGAARDTWLGNTTFLPVASSKSTPARVAPSMYFLVRSSRARRPSVLVYARSSSFFLAASALRRALSFSSLDRRVRICSIRISWFLALRRSVASTRDASSRSWNTRYGLRPLASNSAASRRLSAFRCSWKLALAATYLVTCSNALSVECLSSSKRLVSFECRSRSCDAAASRCSRTPFNFSLTRRYASRRLARPASTTNRSRSL